ncbi:MAG: EAL domain-containing protein [Succinivibrio sp.]
MGKGIPNIIARAAAALAAALVLIAAPAAALSAEAPLRFGYQSSLYYFTKDGDSGHYSGYLFDYLEALSLYLERRFTYVQCDGTPALDRLREGGVDVMTVMVADEHGYGYPFDIIPIPIARAPVFLGLRHGPADLYAERRVRIGYVSDAISEMQINSTLSAKGFRLPSGASFVPCNTYSELISLYRDGLIDGLVFSSVESTTAIPIVAELAQQPVYLAVRKGNDNLRRDLQQAVARLGMNEPWLENLLSVKHLMSGAPLILSSDEQAYLDSHKSIRAVVSSAQKPYSYIENGVHKGLIREITKVFEKDLGVTFEVTGADSTTELFSMVRSGQADVVLNMYDDYNWADSNGMHITRPYIDVDYVAVTRDDYEAKRDPVIAAPYDYFMIQDFVEKRFPKNQITYYSNDDDCLRAVASGSADMAFMKQLTAQTEISRLGLSNLAVNGSVVFTHSVGIGVSDRMDPMLVGILNKEITHIDKSNFRRLVNKMVYESMPQQTALSIIHHNPLKAIAAVAFSMALIIAGLLYVMSERRRNYKAIQRVYYTNMPTGLPNERWFADTMGQEIGGYKAERARGCLFVLLVTIRQMEVLQKGYDPKLIQEAVRDWFNVLRSQFPWMIGGAVSGDLSTSDFLCILPDGKTIESLMGDLGKQEAKFMVNGVSVTVHTVCGICFVPKGTSRVSMQNLLVSARMARDEAVESGARFAVYDDELEQHKIMHQRIENLMDKALAGGEFEVWMQPKYDILTRRIVGAEALVRWRSPELGFLMPGAFIDLFERNAFVIKLDYYMLRRVRMFQQDRARRGKEIVPVSVNQSGLHFSEDHYIDEMKRVVTEIPVPPGSVELEVTESAFIDLVSKEQRRNAQGTIYMLRRMGYTISMDDFSKGYSSLSTMLSLPMDTVKIDIAMLHAAEESARSRKILEGIVRMCDGLGMKVICEGVETKEHEQLLLSCGCHYGQGFLFSRPVKLERFMEMLDRQGSGLDPLGDGGAGKA